MIAEQIEQGGRTLADLIRAYEKKLFMAVFYAEWCSPCRRLLKEVLPIVAKLAGKGVVICPIDVGETRNYTASREHKSTNVPTTLFFWGGKEIDRIRGMAKSDDFLYKINCYQKKKTNA